MRSAGRLSLVVSPILNAAGVPNGGPLAALPVTALVVFMMVYVVMPRYSRLMQPWIGDASMKQELPWQLAAASRLPPRTLH